MHGPLAFHVAGVTDRSRLEEHDFDFVLGNRPVLDPAGHDDKIALKLDHLHMLAVQFRNRASFSRRLTFSMRKG